MIVGKKKYIGAVSTRSYGEQSGIVRKEARRKNRRQRMGQVLNTGLTAHGYWN
jgi:hypothetical protein